MCVCACMHVCVCECVAMCDNSLIRMSVALDTTSIGLCRFFVTLAGFPNCCISTVGSYSYKHKILCSYAILISMCIAILCFAGIIPNDIHDCWAPLCL